MTRLLHAYARTFSSVGITLDRGGWAPQTIAHLDRANATAILALLASIKEATWYPDTKDIDRPVATKGRKPISDL